MLLPDLICVGIGIAGVAPWKHIPKKKESSQYYITVAKDRNEEKEGGKDCLVIKQDYRKEFKPWPTDLIHEYPYGYRCFNTPIKNDILKKIQNNTCLWAYPIQDDTQDEDIIEWIADLQMKIKELEEYKTPVERAKELLNAYG